MKKIKIGIFGPGGRMGRDLLEQIENFNSLELTVLCEKEKHKDVGKTVSGIVIGDDINNLIKYSDVIIDFTVPEATINLLKVMHDLKTKTALVTGTTGYTKTEEKKFQGLVNGRKVLRSFNMSIGINLMKNLIKAASKNISSQSDIEIVEIHHNKKKDIPSGTAISLAKSVQEGFKGIAKFSYREENKNKARGKNEIGFASIRGGDVIGEHTVYFFLNGERIELRHIASSRKIFSVGALKAASWLHQKKAGLYTISDMLKE